MGVRILDPYSLPTAPFAPPVLSPQNGITLERRSPNRRPPLQFLPGWNTIPKVPMVVLNPRQHDHGASSTDAGRSRRLPLCQLQPPYPCATHGIPPVSSGGHFKLFGTISHVGTVKSVLPKFDALRLVLFLEYFCSILRPVLSVFTRGGKHCHLWSLRDVKQFILTSGNVLTLSWDLTSLTRL